MDEAEAMRPNENRQQMQGMILQLFQELMGAPSALFSRHQDLVEQLDKAQAAAGRSHEGFHMPQMVKEDDPEAYLESVERFAMVDSCDVSRWAFQLGLSRSGLTGHVQALYQALACTEVLNYQTVKDAILYWLETSPEHYQEQF